MNGNNFFFFTNNLFPKCREAALVCVFDTCISVLASMVIFAVVGAISHGAGMPMVSTLESGE